HLPSRHPHCTKPVPSSKTYFHTCHSFIGPIYPLQKLRQKNPFLLCLIKSAPKAASENAFCFVHRFFFFFSNFILFLFVIFVKLKLMDALRLIPPQPPLLRHKERVAQTSFPWPHVSKKCIIRPWIRAAVSKPTAEISSPNVTSRENAVVSSSSSSFAEVSSAPPKKVSANSLQYPSGYLGAAPERSKDEGNGDVINAMGYLTNILSSKVYDVAIESPLQSATKLSERLGNQVWLKREDLQPVFSFKLRGAYNMMAKLPKGQLERGVICSSAGNHAQGVALAAKRLGCNAEDMFEEKRSILEPAGALALAGAEAYCKYYGLKGKNIVAITSGANMNFDKLRVVTELANVGRQQEAVLATILPEEPGSFKQFCELVGPMNITEFKYRCSSEKEAVVLYSVGVHTVSELGTMKQRMESSQLRTYNLTASDLVKDHLRYLMGGRLNVENEVLCRFIFPERPGALMKFLDTFSPRWNISLFHYRGQGETGANVLVGIQVAKGEMEEFHHLADRLGYDYVLVTDDKDFQLLMH
ncbi:L-O-methylthreonine resistant 1 isoform 2, partial [Theobroma cacao]